MAEGTQSEITQISTLLLCPGCYEFGAYSKRQNTAYIDDELNFAILCESCHEINDQHWLDMWAEYWSMVR